MEAMKPPNCDDCDRPITLAEWTMYTASRQPIGELEWHCGCLSGSSVMYEHVGTSTSLKTLGEVDSKIERQDEDGEALPLKLPLR
jgi:hypothetical protein